MRYIAALHQGVIEVILMAVLGVIVVRHYGVYALLHPDAYRGRRAGTGRGKRWRGWDVQRHEFKELSYFALSVSQVMERTKLVMLPSSVTLLPVTEGSWYHDRLLEGHIA
jgi:hypothetical protein